MRLNAVHAQITTFRFRRFFWNVRDSSINVTVIRVSRGLVSRAVAPCSDHAAAKEIINVNSSTVFHSHQQQTRLFSETNETIWMKVGRDWSPLLAFVNSGQVII